MRPKPDPWCELGAKTAILQNLLIESGFWSQQDGSVYIVEGLIIEVH